MYQLQILEKDRYTVLAEENRINLRLLAPPRGRILDRFGVALADNRRNYRSSSCREQAGDVGDAGRARRADRDQRRRPPPRTARRPAQAPLRAVVVRANLSWDEMARIEVAVRNWPASRSTRGMIRHYPSGDRGACRRLCRGGLGAGADRRPAARTARTSASARAASRKSQDLTLRGARAPARSRSTPSAG